MKADNEKQLEEQIMGGNAKRGAGEECEHTIHSRIFFILLDISAVIRHGVF